MSQAIDAHGTLLKIGSGGTAGDAITITSTTHDDDAVATIVTCAAAHGFVDRQPVTIAGVTGAGATGVNGSRIVNLINSTMFWVEVATTADGSGGTATPVSETFTTIAEVGDIDLPEMSNDREDVTTHDSPGRTKEWLVTTLENGECSFPINWVPTDATHDETTGLLSSLVDGEARNFQIVLPDDGNYTLQFAAHVLKFAPKAPVSGALTADITLGSTGEVIFTA